MRIYYSEGSDPMITGKVAELNGIASELEAFLSSSAEEIYLPANTDGSPRPYQALLPGFRISRGSGPLSVTLEPSVGLSVSGSTENLATWCSHFRFAPESQDGDHQHTDHVHRSGYLQAGALHVIIEVFEDDPSAG
jgi:hypothetical protein